MKIEQLAEKLFPTDRLLWDSNDGPAMRNPKPTGPRYIALPVVKPKSGTRKPTEAEDNARGRAIRRRRNKALRGWRPYAQR